MSSNTKAILFFALAILAVILISEMANAQYGGGRYHGGRGYGGYGGRGYGGYGGRGYGGGYGGRGYGGGYGGHGGRGYGGGYGGRGYGGGYGRGSRSTSYGSSYSGSGSDNYPSDLFTSNDLSQSDNEHDGSSYGGSYGGDGYFSSYDIYTASSSAQPSTATVAVAQPASVQPDRQTDWQLEQENSRVGDETPRLLWNTADGRGQQAPVNVFDGPYDMITGDRLPEGQMDNNRQAMTDRNGNFESRQGNRRTSGASINNKKQQDSLIASLNATPMVPTSTTTAAPEYVMINPTRNSSRNNKADTAN